MSIRSLTLPAPAKLNLFLHITGRRADGYHELQTVFRFLDYGDDITFDVTDDARIQRVAGNEAIPEADDLLIRAARLLQQETACSQGVNLSINKRLPMGGGLGGGSSDAATVLQGLNVLWQLGLSDDALAELGLQLGADVPVFVRGHAAWAEGVGEVIRPVELAERWYLVIHPSVHVSTAEIFADTGLTRNCQIITIATFLAGQCQNVFEPVVRKHYPAVAEALDWLSQFADAKLTGSGSCLFADFADETSAEHVLQKLPAKWLGFVAHSGSVSPLQQAIRQLS